MYSFSKNCFKRLNIVVVEDNVELCDILVTGLSYFGHFVRGAGNGFVLDQLMAENPADIVILDLGLPGEDGISIARRLRRDTKCGIVMVTARSSLDERILGLDVGADQYFVKPVNLSELNASLNSLSRRISVRKDDYWQFAPKVSQLITPHGVKVPLTSKEFILVRKLLEYIGETVSRDEIFSALMQPNDIYADKRLETTISRLRFKIKVQDPQSELPIKARHNLGYAFLADAVIL